MRGRLRLREPGVRLIPSDAVPGVLPSWFRGAILQGTEAARRASRVAGPFEASPSAYVTPVDEEMLGRLLAWCWEHGVSVIPRGGGTGMPGGNLGPYLIVEPAPGPTESASVVRLQQAGSRFGRISVAASTIAQDAALVAGRHGGALPFLPSSSRWCRIGGMVANNAAGARSFKSGATSAWVETLEGFHAWGEPFRVGVGLPVPRLFRKLRESLLEASAGSLDGWPRLRKNSSGYALDRFLRTGDPAQLLVGSEGTLGFLTRVELRMAAEPPCRGLVLLPARSPAEVAALALAAGEIQTDTCEILGRRFLAMSRLHTDPEVGEVAREAYAILLLEVSGTRDEVDDGMQVVQEVGAHVGGRGIATREPREVDRFWELRRAASPMIGREAERGRISTQFIEDSVVPPDAVGAYLEGVDRILDSIRFDAVVFGHAGDGNVHVNPLVDIGSADWRSRVRQALDDVTNLVSSLGGTLAGEHGDGRLRAPLLHRIYPPRYLEAFRIVKETLDPRGILNPGVILPLPGQDPLEGFSPRPPLRHPH